MRGTNLRMEPVAERRNSNKAITEPLSKPSLGDLLVAVDEVLRRFQNLCERYPPEPLSREPDNMPVRHPLSLSWKPEAGGSAIPGIVAEVIEWAQLFGIYLINLKRYFIDWRERPDAFERFPVNRYPFSRHDQMTSHEQMIAILQEHTRLLVVEAEKRLAILPQTLPHLLRSEQKIRGLTQAEMAKRLKISLARYKSWAQGKAFPRETMHLKLSSFFEQSGESSNQSNPERK